MRCVKLDQIILIFSSFLKEAHRLRFILWSIVKAMVPEGHPSSFQCHWSVTDPLTNLDCPVEYDLGRRPILAD